MLLLPFLFWIIDHDNHRPVVSSRKVAEVFGKEHKHVMEAIRAIECDKEFNQSNFRPVEYTDAKGELRPEYLLTRDGFTLLVMGFTGAKAMQFKIKYIEAFNAMEKQIAYGSLPDFNFRCPLDGEYKVGHNWAETH